jgi:uncharacterized membrane protein YozB (DUF420 family)
MNREAFPMTWKVFRAAMIGGLALLYAIGVILSTRALRLLPQGKEVGPEGHPYPPWTVIHFAAALLFAVLAMMQLLSGLRRRYPALHRYSGRVAVLCGLIVAMTGTLIPFAVVPPRPLVERVYIVLFFTGVALFLLLGFRAARRHDYAHHRVWMVRAVASAGAVVTQRIFFTILAITFGFHSETDFWMEFVAAFAFGWVFNLTLAEVWLRWKPLRPVQAA